MAGTVTSSHRSRNHTPSRHLLSTIASVSLFLSVCAHQRTPGSVGIEEASRTWEEEDGDRKWPYRGSLVHTARIYNVALEKKNLIIIFAHLYLDGSISFS